MRKNGIDISRNLLYNLQKNPMVRRLPFSAEDWTDYMMNFLEKSRNKLVHFIFSHLEGIFPFVVLVLIIAAWSVPETYWQIRVVLIWLWLVTIEIDLEGTMERDFLPIQPGSSRFYHIYRFTDRFFFLFLLILLADMLILPVIWLTYVFIGAIVPVTVIRAVGDRKYRPKKPEEE